MPRTPRPLSLLLILAAGSLCGPAARADVDPGLAALRSVLPDRSLPLNSTSRDLDGDGRPEELVLYGGPDESGTARARGLAVVARDGQGWRRRGFGRFDAVAGTLHRVLSDEQDLDGDGRNEVLIEARTSRAGFERVALTWWRWQPGPNAALVPVLSSESEVTVAPTLAVDAAAPEVRRELEAIAPVDGRPRLRERVTRTALGGRIIATDTIVYELDADAGRFVPVRWE